MDKRIGTVSKIGGTIRVPGDKSISHRALIFGALCEGDMTVANLSTAADCASTARCLRELGIDIDNRDNGTVIVHGRGRFGFRETGNVLDAGNSGTTMRLLAGLLSGQPFFTVINGDDSLRNRPMKRIIEPLTRMGAHISARQGGTKPPLAITGVALKPITYELPVASAQVKSAILIAGLLTGGRTTVIENIPSRDHTERLLEYLGANIDINGSSCAVEDGEIRPARITVPGDISSAFYFVLAGMLANGPGVRVDRIGLNPTRTGGIDVLRRMGAEIEVSTLTTHNGEPSGDITIHRSRLSAIDISPSEIPSMVDEIPALALAATQADGKTTISGARELRYKESDRLHTVAIELNRLGAAIVEREDGLEIDGPTPLRGTTVQSHGDHRLSMTLAIAGLIASGETVIQGAETVEVSYPDFFQTLSALAE